MLEVLFDGQRINNDLIVGLKYAGRLFNDGEPFVLGTTVCQSATLEVADNGNLPTPKIISIKSDNRLIRWPIKGSDTSSPNNYTWETTADGRFVINGRMLSRTGGFQIGYVHIKAGESYELRGVPKTEDSGVNNMRLYISNNLIGTQEQAFSYEMRVDGDDPISAVQTALHTGWAAVYLRKTTNTAWEYDNYTVSPRIQENGVHSVNKEYVKAYGNDFLVDNIKKQNGKIIYELSDRMVQLNFKYDAQPLIEASSREETDGTKYVLGYELMQDILSKAGLKNEAGFASEGIFYNKHISYYDSTVTAREYIGMIAELNSSFAYVIDDELFWGHYGGGYFNSLTTNTINIDECAEYELGEQHIMSRVAMENSPYTPVGIEGHETIYLNPNNVFITSQSDLQSIYNGTLTNNTVLGFWSYSAKKNSDYLDIPGYAMVLTDGNNSYKVFNQFEAEYSGGWSINYSMFTSNEDQENTLTINGVEDNYRRLKFEMDRNKNAINLVAEKTQIISDRKVGTGTIQIHNAYKGILHKLEVQGYMQESSPGQGITLTIDETNYQLPIDVLNYISQEVQDTFIYEDGHCIIHRMVDPLNTTTPLSDPYDEDKGDLELYVDSDSILTLPSYPNADLICEYLLANNYTSQFANKVETKGSIEVLDDKIDLSVAAVADSQGVITPASIILAINNDTSSVDISADKINLTGYITATDLRTAGSTTINGGNITTGTINGNNVNVTNINASNINTGTLNGRPITGGTLKNTGCIFDNGFGATTIHYPDYTGEICGYHNPNFVDDPWDYTANRRYVLQRYSSGAALFIYNSSGNLASYFDETGPHTSSDIRYKKNVKNIEQEKSINIIKGLDPITYDYGEERTFRGLSAQQVEEVMKKNGYENQIYNISKEGTYSLSYEQIIPDLINCIKYLSAKVEELEKKENKNG